MRILNYLILLLIVLFSSCGNSPSDASEANYSAIGKSDNSVKEIGKAKPVDSALHKVWTTFQNAISTNNFSQFKQLSLDSLNSCDTTLSTIKFIKNCYNDVFDSLLIRKISTPTEIDQSDIEMELGYFTKSVLNKADYTGDFITLKQFQVIKEFTPDGAWTITFDFIKTKEGYRFFGCNSYGGPICCR